ncbi:MAG: glycosyltransferase family 2 protein, partial [Egibacteraceae bacterium]
PDPAPASGHALLPPPALNKQASVGQAVRPAAPDPAGGHVLLFLPALDEEASAGHVVRPATPAAPDPASGHALLPPPALDEEASAGHVVGPAAPDPAGGHVLLFLPALDEEASVGHVVRPATPAAPDPAGGHVLLFLPALDEEASVGQVVRRVPATVCGRPVRCLVIDDGSTDQTAGAAAAAGARVLSLGANQGLGAAVRHGLAMGVAEGSSAIAFCDADGEYAPEELERLIAPILGGDADYVVGSRFTGQIRRMPAHRRLGNLALTQALRWIARTPITDGQSGYRALSAAAAARAEIVHDFNYAQVLTLDLLAKGFRYAEVPISYSFRQTGRSFVRLGRYLRHVIPAVWAELNGPSDRNPRPRSRLTRPAPSPRPEGCSPGRTAPADQA